MTWSSCRSGSCSILQDANVSLPPLRVSKLPYDRLEHAVILVSFFFSSIRYDAISFLSFLFLSPVPHHRSGYTQLTLTMKCAISQPPCCASNVVFTKFLRKYPIYRHGLREQAYADNVWERIAKSVVRNADIARGVFHLRQISACSRGY